MRRRVEEVLDALGVAHLRDRNPAELSGGERQRCAIAGALATAPEVLVLDEPTSQLDPQGAEDVLAAVARLNADLGTTVVLAEHRLERAAPLADGAVLIADGRITAAAVPPAPCSPPIRARRRSPASVTTSAGTRSRSPCATRCPRGTRRTGPTARRRRRTPRRGELLLRGRGLDVALGRNPVLHAVDLDVAAGDVLALLGRNGSGKTTLLRALAGLVPPDAGRHRRHRDPCVRAPGPVEPAVPPTVRAEIAETLRLLGRRDDGAVESWIDALGLRASPTAIRGRLSGGERQRVAIAAVAVGGATVLLLDEPTRGMDAASRARSNARSRTHRDTGGAVVLATHDVELAARCATRATVLGDGEVVAEGPARDVLTGSLFAPQIARVAPRLPHRRGARRPPWSERDRARSRLRRRAARRGPRSSTCSSRRRRRRVPVPVLVPGGSRAEPGAQRRRAAVGRHHRRARSSPRSPSSCGAGR